MRGSLGWNETRDVSLSENGHAVTADAGGRSAISASAPAVAQRSVVPLGADRCGRLVRPGPCPVRCRQKGVGVTSYVGTQYLLRGNNRAVWSKLASGDAPGDFPDRSEMCTINKTVPLDGRSTIVFWSYFSFGRTGGPADCGGVSSFAYKTAAGELTGVPRGHFGQDDSYA